jgi:hypothetical protein
MNVDHLPEQPKPAEAPDNSPLSFTIAAQDNGNVMIGFSRNLNVMSIGAQNAVRLAEYIIARAKDAAKAAGITLVFEEKT